ncbi:MAG: asparagine synthase C-terminal domain-containing protein [Thermoplasmata archaeon]
MRVNNGSIGRFTAELENAIKNAVLDCTKNEERIAIPFSGGIDSSIIALLASRNTDAVLYSVGVDGAYDLKMADTASKALGLELTKIEINKKDIEEAVPRLMKIAGSVNAVEISFELPLYFVAKESREQVLVSGQGADELFGGYAKYISVERSKLHETLQKDVELVQNVGVPRERKIARCFKKELRTPFLSTFVVSTAMKIPVEYKIYEGVRKYILREVGRSIGINEEIVTRAKKAAQYGSGTMNLIKKLAKENGMGTSQYISSISSVEFDRKVP